MVLRLRTRLRLKIITGGGIKNNKWRTLKEMV